MMFISILTRRLKRGKTYEDFRKAWYHTVGYGAPVRLYSAINVFDQREIIVVGMGEISPGQDLSKLVNIEVKERLDRPLEGVIEPEIGRTFGIVVSEDDFSPRGRMEFRPASVKGQQTDFKEVAQALATAQEWLTRAAAQREAAKKQPLRRAKQKASHR